MEDDLAYLHERIPAYADYNDQDARHLVDKQVRAYLGEALSRLRERLGSSLAPSAAERLEDLLLKCEFTNQQFVHLMDTSKLDTGEVELLHVVDHALVSAADQADAITQPTVGAFLSELESLFARRLKAVFHPAA